MGTGGASCTHHLILSKTNLCKDERLSVYLDEISDKLIERL
jgi:hypothetical protein